MLLEVAAPLLLQLLLSCVAAKQGHTARWWGYSGVVFDADRRVCRMWRVVDCNDGDAG
jgi:hypothetical protein